MASTTTIKTPSFRGLKNEDLESFIAQMELRFYDNKIITDLDKVLKTCMSLKGDAATWVAPYLKRFIPERLLGYIEGEKSIPGAWTDYKDFCQWLRIRHGKYYNTEQEAEKKIFSLQQGRTTVTELNAEFDRLRAQLSDKYTAEVLLFFYKKALNSDVIARASSNPGSETWDLDTWMKNTMVVESNRQFNMQRGGVYLPRHGKGNNVTYHPSVSDPDAMEVDNLNIEGQRISSTRRKTSKETRVCYQCGMKGHLKKNCRRKAKSSRFKKSVRQNALSIDEVEPMDEDNEEQEHF